MRAPRDGKWIAYIGKALRDGIVEKVGSSDEIARAIPRDATLIDAEQRVVLPGFVDAHTHPVFAGNRVDELELRATGATYEEIARRGGGIQSTVRKTRAASETELCVRRSAASRACATSVARRSSFTTDCIIAAKSAPATASAMTAEVRAAKKNLAWNVRVRAVTADRPVCIRTALP